MASKTHAKILLIHLSDTPHYITCPAVSSVTMAQVSGHFGEIAS